MRGTSVRIAAASFLLALSSPALGAEPPLRWLALNNVLEGQAGQNQGVSRGQSPEGYEVADAYTFRAKSGQRIRFNIICDFAFRIDIERVDKVDPFREFRGSVGIDSVGFGGLSAPTVAQYDAQRSKRPAPAVRNMQTLESTGGDKSFTWAVPSEGVFRIVIYSARSTSGSYRLRTWDLASPEPPVQFASLGATDGVASGSAGVTTTPNAPTTRRRDEPSRVADAKPKPIAVPPKTPVTPAPAPVVVAAAQPPASTKTEELSPKLAEFLRLPAAQSLAQPSNGPKTVEPAASTLVQLPKKSPAWAKRLPPRIALVVGISRYTEGLEALPNPINDARLVAAQLQELGFDVELALDADQKSLKRAISRLGERMSKAGSHSTGLFYYAGHGIQSRGVNYLIPATAQIYREADVDLEAVAADSVLLQMQEAGETSTNIVILDACRNMPLARAFRGSGKGLARMEAPTGTFISYSTAPGSVAYDGAGVNSPYAEALSNEIKRRGEPIEAVFRSVRKKVLDSTSGQQTPWDSSSLIDQFLFVPN